MASKSADRAWMLSRRVIWGFCLTLSLLIQVRPSPESSRQHRGATPRVALSIAKAQAYPKLPFFSLPAQNGGAAGRFFTGSWSDGYTCKVCHPPVERFDFRVEGLPDYVVPGESYDFQVHFGHPDDGYAYAFAAEIASIQAGSPGELTGFEANITSPEDPTLIGRHIIFADKHATRRSVALRWQVPVDLQGPIWLFLAGIGGDASSTPQGDSAGVLHKLIQVATAPGRGAS